jgi:hypothetical protein
MTDEKKTDDAEHPAPKATDELAEAAKHLKHAAQILFAKAAKDPTLKSAAEEAEKLVEKVSTTAEPLAKQLASELGKLGREIAKNLEGKPKAETPPPAEGAAEAKPAAESPDDAKT